MTEAIRAVSLTLVRDSTRSRWRRSTSERSCERRDLVARGVVETGGRKLAMGAVGERRLDHDVVLSGPERRPTAPQAGSDNHDSCEWEFAPTWDSAFMTSVCPVAWCTYSESSANSARTSTTDGQFPGRIDR